MRKQRWHARAGLLAGFLLLAGLTAGAVRPAFPDLAGHSYEFPIRVLARQGIVQGFEDGTFRPYRFLTRAEFAKLLVLALGRGEEVTRAAAGPARFTDMAGHWARGYVEIAAELGLVQGYPDGTFRPEATITRAELVVLVARAGGLEGKAQKMPADASFPYRDAAEIPSWARPLVWAAAEEGLLEGLFPGRMLPQRAANRAEAAALVARLAARLGRFYDLAGTVVEWELEERRLVVETAAGRRVTLSVSPEAFISRSGIPSETIKPLDQIWLLQSPTGQVEFLEVRFQDLLGFRPQLEGNQLTFVESGRPFIHTVTLTDATRIFVNGRPATRAELAEARRVYVVRDVSTGTVRLVDAVRYNHYGTPIWVDPSDGWVQFETEAGEVRDFFFAPDAVIFDQGRRVAPAELTLGLPAMVEAEGDTIHYLQTEADGGR